MMSGLIDYLFGDGTDIPQEVLDALGNVDVDRCPDGVYRVDLGDDGWIAFGEDDGWWTATRYESDDTDHMIYEGEDLAELGRRIADSVAP